MIYNKFNALVENVQAIELAMRIRLRGRRPTLSEKEVLSRYSGFGGIKEVLDIGTDNPIDERMAEPVKRLQRLIAEYPYFNEGMRYNVIESVKASVLTAFYTPQLLIDAVAASIQAAFRKNNLHMRSLLEPSAGIGGFLPVAMAKTEDYAFEKDYLSGLILSLLHDNTVVETAGFETIGERNLDRKTFDVVVSNIPFGNIAVYDGDFAQKGGIYRQAMKTVHNYFFVKAMELLGEGGILAFVTSRGVADAPGNKFVREYLVNRANLITALRLPDNLFMQTSGIKVGSDLLIFQKNSRKKTLSNRERMFTETMQEMVDTDGTTTECFNKYFTLPHTTLSTESRIVTNQFGKFVRKYEWKNGEEAMAQYLLRLLTHNFDLYFDKSLFTPEKTAEPVQLSLFDLFAESQTVSTVLPKPNLKNRTYTDAVLWWMKDGTLVAFEGQLGRLQYRRADHFADESAVFVPLKSQPSETERVMDYMALREAYFDLYRYEDDTRIEHKGLRKELNRRYDAFVGRWGCLHHADNTAIVSLDISGMEVCTIEIMTDGKAAKADIMFEPVAFKRIDTNLILTPTEALASSLNYYGRVDMDYLVKATDKSECEVIGELEGEIFYNPVSGDWEHRGLFLAGNVIAKSKKIRSCMAELSGEELARSEKAVRALESVFPETIPYEELDFNMGERWIPESIYADFAQELFDTTVEVKYFDVNDTYVVAVRGYSPVVYNTYAVKNYNGEDLFVYALHDTVPEITKSVYRDGKSVSVPDEEAIQEASTKIQEIRRRFNEWLDRQPIAVRDYLVRLYNERFNCYVRPHYDGSAQTFPNLSFEQFPYNELYPSQKDAVWMIKQNGGGVCWHEVGAGKTMVMCVAAYEMKRLGLVQKPLIIGLKANVHEIADTFRKAYPSAKLLYPGKEDFTPAKRYELFNKIKNGNWDCIILTHDQFGKIPQSDETMYNIFREELSDVERSLEVLEEQSGIRYRSRAMQKGLEKRKQNLEAKLAELKHNIDTRKDDCIDFHTMGIDHLFVDECHMFKNLMFQTRHTRVAGIGNTQGSQRAMNLLVAIRDIQRRTDKDLGATFLSGTVVVNALTELYVLFKYLRPHELQRQAISCFDAWAAIFTQKTTDYEIGVTGSIKRKERFRTYIKVPELAAFLREITDYRTAEMIHLDVPEKNVRFLTSTPTAEQEDMIARLVAFAGSGCWEDLGLDMPAPENLDKAKMLVATDIARKASLDMRMLGDKFSDDADNKAARCAAAVYDYYVRSAANKGTQFVFSDLSTYKPHEWNIYADIRDKLVAMGIPSEEIQFIQTAKTEAARKRVIADMNAGRVRVLFGSTSMLGTGVNAQQRAVAVHHLDIPWRPADLEQRNGRAVRKGNSVKLWGGNTVDVIIYGTEKTLDAYKFNLLKNKQMFINQINSGTVAARRIDEDSMDENNGMNFAEFVAILSGNNDLLNKAKLDSKIGQLEKEQLVFNKERYRAERKIEKNRQDITQYRRNIERMTEDRAYCTAYNGGRQMFLLSAPQATTEEIGRELHRIARSYRGGNDKTIGSYMGLTLTVHSLYNLDGSFDRNVFHVEGKSGLKYPCSASGSLPSGFAESVAYPQTALDRLPSMIERQQKNLAQLESELPTLDAIVARQWGRREELAALRSEREALQKRIDETLKEAERKNQPVGEAA